MFHKWISFSATSTLILGSILAYPRAAVAQHHGGGHGMGGAIPGGSNRPTGLDEKDSLKDFHQALAMQATGQQIAEFQALVANIAAAQAETQVLLRQVKEQNGTAESSRREALTQTLAKVRSEHKQFQEGFSAAQKAGLKDIVKRLARTDSDLEQEEMRLDQSLDAKAAGPEVVAHAESFDKLLADFYNQELALGRELDITVATGQDLAFTLPQVKSPVHIENRTVAITVSGALSQVAVQGGQRIFKLELISDLSDLQQNVTELMRVQLNASPTCGQRVAVQRATLTPSSPTGLLVVQLHFERWTCTQAFGQQSANELAEGDGSVEVKLMVTVEPPNALKVVAALGRIDATGMMAEELRSGYLGDDLREKAAQAVLAAARAGSDFKVSLPPAVQNSAVIQSARFQDAGVGGLSIALDGQIEISDQQADQLASQINQSLSAQRTPAQGTIPQLTTRPQ